MNSCLTEVYLPYELVQQVEMKGLTCFSKLKNESFDVLINEKPFSVLCYEVFPREKGVFENIVTMDVLAKDFDLDQAETKWINFSGRFYPPRLHKIESCGPIHKYKLKAIIPEKDFWV